jgi:hypothetical protein
MVCAKCWTGSTKSTRDANVNLHFIHQSVIQATLGALKNIRTRRAPVAVCGRRIAAGQRHHMRRCPGRDRTLAGLARLVASNPSRPSWAKRCCQRQTIGRLTATSVATRCTDRRFAEASTARGPFNVLVLLVGSEAIPSSRPLSDVLNNTHTVCASAQIRAPLSACESAECVSAL